MKFVYQFERTRAHFDEFQNVLMTRLAKQRHVKYWRWAHEVSFALLWICLGSTAVLLYGTWASLAGTNLLFQYLLGAAILAVVFASTLRVLGYFNRKSSMKNMLSESGSVLGKWELTISDSGLLLIGTHQRFEYSWAAIEEVLETENLALFLTDGVAGVICPRASIPDEEYEGVIRFSRKNMGG